jgi:predicted RNase H-like nuclease (RuvC/YqgF family)
MLKGVESIGVDDPEVREAIDNDPLVRQLTDGLAVSKQSYKPDQKGELEARLDSRRAALLAIVRSRQQTPVVAQIRRLEATIDVAAQRQKELEQGVNETQKEVDKPGRSSVEVEMARAEVKNLEAALARLATEKENLGFELRGRPRVRLRQPAEVPEP